MKRLELILLALITGLASLLFLRAYGNREKVHGFEHENVLGTSLDLKVVARGPAEAAKAEAVVLAEIDRLNRILSAWNPDSEFSRWARTQGVPVAVSEELFEVLSLYDRWQAASAGAINASAAAAANLWRKASLEQREPSAQELQGAVDLMRQKHWSLDARTRTATHLDQVPLVLASFTKSYIGGKAAKAAIRSTKARGVVLNLGGDLIVQGNVIESVMIRDPRANADNDRPMASIPVRNAAVATSGGYRRGVDIRGRHYSHVIDPRTGRSADAILSSTVRADDPATAGALATAFSVLSPEASVLLARQHAGVEYLIVTRAGKVLASEGWQGIEMTARSSALSAIAGQNGSGTAGWNGGFELVINFALATVQDFRYRRPFVAVWIEDKDRFPVRTLALWYDKPRWIPDLRSWYRGDRMRALAEGSEIMASVSSATRPPGRYSLKWDGLDNAGKPVKPGKYTVYIEAAREHGTYQLMRHEMEFNGIPQQAQLAANGIEIESASLDYHKITR